MSTENNEELKPYIEHLEFLGYKVESIGEEKKVFRAKEHPTRWAMVFLAFRRGVLFTVSFGCEDAAKAIPSDILKFANELNRRFIFCRAVIDKDNDLNIETVYRGTYEKREFGIFLDDIESEIRGGFENNKDESKRILK